MRWPGTRRFVKRLASEISEDGLLDTAAALAFWGLLALFPFLLFVVALVGLVVDPASLHNLLGQLALVAPRPVTNILSAQLDWLLERPHTRLLTIGAVVAIWAASGGLSALIQALDRCNDVRETRPYWKTRALAIASTLVAGIAGVVAVVSTFVVPFIGRLVGGPLGKLITWSRFPVAGGVVLALCAYFYWALPNDHPRFRFLSVGSLVAMALWLFASWAFGEYVRRSGSYEAMYGALGGIIILLLWMWISSLTLLLGAEINKILTS